MLRVSLGKLTLYLGVSCLFTYISLVSAVDDWVLHVPEGKQSADIVASEHGLDNLGEVIPETNLFHFKQNSQKRRKRSLEALTEAFEAHPAIRAHMVQDQSLSRVKRGPLPEEENDESFVHLVKRAPPDDPPTPVRSTGNQICFINTIATDTKESRRCIFPFSYKGKTYVQCTADHSGNEAEWCATQVDAEGEVINKQWGDCDTKSLSCLTLGAGSIGQSRPAPKSPKPPTPIIPKAQPAPPPPAPECFTNGGANPNKPCIFPFTWNGAIYRGCPVDPDDENQRWCSTKVDANGLHIQGQDQWGHCSPSCPISAPPPKRPAPPQRPAAPQGQPRLPSGLFPQNSQGFPPQGFPPGFNPQQQQGGAGRAPPRGPPRPNPNVLPGQAPKSSSSNLPSQFQADPQAILKAFIQQAGIQTGTPNDDEWPEADRSQFKTYLNDIAWPSMWYLNRGEKGYDMNVEEAWALGITGKGVVLTILDDGVEHTHPDLKQNYDTQASIDLNGNDADPFPRYDPFNSNKHGTRCAGTIAAQANNSDCAVGIAYNSKIGGVRILDGPILDALEAKAISFNRNHIDIYSASWGPDDDGRTVDGPGPLAKLALEEGIKKGRNGKGSIYVWASGNGGKHFDNCNCDGYATSRYTLSISSVSEKGTIPWYSEACSSTLTTTFSSGSTKPERKERKVITTDLHGKCTKRHTGTSASSPMAAGIVALALESNPNLTWRDVQHIIVRTSIPRGLLKANDWANNSVGLEFSHSYGFGLMDAGAMVRLAKEWKKVPEVVKCKTLPGQSGVTSNSPVLIKGGTEESIGLDVSACGDAIKFLEHLHLNIDATSGANRGDLSVLLRSPEGTVSILLGPRPKDTIPTGFSKFSQWPMMSVHFWGEPVVSPTFGGVWTLTIKNSGSRPCILNDWGLTFHGTSEDPQPGVSIRPVFMPLPKRPSVIINTENTDTTRVIEETTASTSELPELESSDHLEVLNERIQVSVDDFQKLLG